MLSTIALIWKQKRNIALFARADFVQNYLASYLGFAWAIIGPLVVIAVLTMVFQLGFRVPPLNDSGVPFPLWLACGMIPWLYIAEGLSSGPACITSYSFLVRKAMFRIYFLPPIRMFSIGIVHVVLVIFLLSLLLYYQISPSVFWLQIFIYLPLLYLFLSSLALLLASLTVFVPDIASATGIITTLGFWATPVFWNPTMLPERFRWIITANPAHYIIQGYRDTFIEQQWIWQRPFADNAIFCLWFFSILAVSLVAYKKLRPHFADVL